VSDNRIIRSAHSGILVFDTEDADVRANHIVEASYYGIWVWLGDRAMVRDNTIDKWATVAGIGVLVQTSERGIVTGNVFVRPGSAPEPYPVRVDPSSIAVVVKDNQLLYKTGLAEPFLNWSQPAP
jgi:hypothetical protein